MKKEKLVEYLKLALEKDDIDSYDSLSSYIESLYKENDLLSFPVNIKKLASILEFQIDEENSRFSEIYNKVIYVNTKDKSYKDMRLQTATLLVKALVSENVTTYYEPVVLENTDFDVRCFKCALLMLLPIDKFQETFFENERPCSNLTIWLESLSGKTQISLFSIGYIYPTINQIIDRRAIREFEKCNYDIDKMNKKYLKKRPTLYF